MLEIPTRGAAHPHYGKLGSSGIAPVGHSFGS